MEEKKVDQMDTRELVTQFLKVCNEAIDHDRLTWRREVPRRLLAKVEGKKIGLAVTKSSTKRYFDFYTIQVRNRKLEFVTRGKQDPEFSFPVTESYLKEVSRNPGKYIENPLKLDWDWVKSGVDKLVGEVAA